MGGYTSVRADVATDQDGAVYLEFSQDGAAWDVALPVKVRANKAKSVAARVQGRFCRVHYVNNASTQTTFRLSCRLTLETHLPTGDDFSAVQADLVPGWIAVTIIGDNESVSTTEGTVWEAPTIGGDNRVTFPEAASVAVASTDAADTSAGTGARTFLITGLDASNNVQTPIVTMNGTTEVNLPGTWNAINGVVMLSAGSGGINAGNVWVGAQGTFTSGKPSTGNQYNVVRAAAGGVSETAAYRVPANCTLYQRHVYLDGEGNKDIEFKFNGQTTLGGPVLVLYRATISGNLNDFNADLAVPGAEAGTTIEMTAETASGVDKARLFMFARLRTHYTHDTIPALLP